MITQLVASGSMFPARNEPGFYLYAGIAAAVTAALCLAYNALRKRNKK